MRDDIKERVIQLGEYIVEQKATVRGAATVFQVSKSTVHKDVTERLAHIDKDLWEEVRAILDLNKMERHLRGGLATKEKYAHKRSV